MPTEESLQQREYAELIQSVDDSRDAGDPFKLSSDTRTTLNTRLANAIATDNATAMSEGDRTLASSAVRTALDNLNRLLHDGYNHIKAIPSISIDDGQRLALFVSYGWPQGQLGDFTDDRIESLANQAIATSPTVSDPAWRYPDAVMTAITTELATLNANQPLAATGDRQQAIDNRDAAVKALRQINSRVRFFYCSASDLLDSTPELARIGRQPRRGPGEAGGGNGNGGNGGLPGAVTLTGQWDEMTQQLVLEWTASSDPNLQNYQPRYTPGATYDETSDFDLNAQAPGTTQMTTTDGLPSPGSVATYRVYVVLTTGEEIASNDLTIQRP